MMDENKLKELKKLKKEYSDLLEKRQKLIEKREKLEDKAFNTLNTTLKKSG